LFKVNLIKVKLLKSKRFYVLTSRNHPRGIDGPGVVRKCKLKTQNKGIFRI